MSEEEDVGYGFDYLTKIIEEQKKYHSLIEPRLRLKYPSQTERLWAQTQAMQAEVGEIHKSLKPIWSWWRANSAKKWVYNLTDDEKFKLIEEGVDLWKFLNEFFLELGIDTAEKLHAAYMMKHDIINKRLEDEKVLEGFEGKTY